MWCCHVPSLKRLLWGSQGEPVQRRKAKGESKNDRTGKLLLKPQGNTDLLPVSSARQQRYVATAVATTKSQPLSDSPVLLPDLVGRVAVLGGNATEKTSCLVGLALRQIHHQGTVLCLDARRHTQTEIYFRLLLRQPTQYLVMPPPGEVSATVGQAVLSTVSRSLATMPALPPLLLLDSIRETPDWERTVIFLLNAGVTIVEALPDPTALVFGRYDTVLLLREETAAAEQFSQAVGRKVSAAELQRLKSGEGRLVHLAQVYHVVLPKLMP